MRALMLVLGFLLGVASALAYAMFVARPPEVTTPAADITDAPVMVTFDDQVVTGLIRRAAQDSHDLGVAPASLSAELRDDTIIVHAAVDVLGGRTDGTVVLHPTIVSGKLHVEVVKASLGSMPLPALEQLVEDQIDKRVGALIAGLPITLTGVRVEHSRGLIVECRVDFDHLTASR